MNPQKPTILFIDDEIETIESLRDLYQEYFEMLTVKSVKEGLKILRQQEVTVVVTDMRMPGLDGADFMSIANDQFRRPIKIILSAYVDDFFNDVFQTQYRPYAIIRKPIMDARNLLQTLQEAVREYEYRYGPSLEPERKEGFLNAQEVLKRLGISKPTLYKFLKSGLPSQRVGGRRLFDWEAVSQWVKNHQPHI